MTTASAYFTPIADTPAMFGSKESGAFAAEFTPKNKKGWLLTLCTCCGDWCYITDGAKFGRETEEAAGDRCIVAAQAWIRSRGWCCKIYDDGYLHVTDEDEDGGCIAGRMFVSISGQPDWLGAARWVHEQENKIKSLTSK